MTGTIDLPSGLTILIAAVALLGFAAVTLAWVRGRPLGTAGIVIGASSALMLTAAAASSIQLGPSREDIRATVEEVVEETVRETVREETIPVVLQSESRVAAAFGEAAQRIETRVADRTRGIVISQMDELRKVLTEEIRRTPSEGRMSVDASSSVSELPDDIRRTPTVVPNLGPVDAAGHPVTPWDLPDGN